MSDDKDTDKPTVEVVRTGTDKEAAELWEQATFHQARRANKLRDVLISIREQIDRVIEEDKTDLD